MGLDLGLVLSDERHYRAFVCAICQQLAGLDALVTTQCSHVYCRSCLPSWLEKSKTCPTCNRDLLYANAGNSSDGSTTGASYQHQHHFSTMPIGDHSHVFVQPLQQAQPLAHRLLRTVLVQCPLAYQNHGVTCPWRGDYYDLQSHLLSGSAHRTCTTVAEPKTTAADVATVATPMDVDGTNDDVDDDDDGGAILPTEETTTAASMPSLQQQQQQLLQQQQQQQLQQSLALAASLKEEANSQFESKHYQEALSLYSKAISVLEEVRIIAGMGDANGGSSGSVGDGTTNSTAAPPTDTTARTKYLTLIIALYSNRSVTLFQLTEYQSCWEDCQYIIQQLDRHYLKAYLRGSKAAVQMGKLNDAQAIVQQGLQVAPTSKSTSALRKEGQHVAALLSAEQRGRDELTTKQYGAAKGTFGNLLKEAPSAVPFLLGAAQADLGLGLTDSALRLTKRVLLKHPQSAMGCWVRGQALFLMEEFGTGLQLMQESLRLDPDCDDAIKRSFKTFRQIHKWMEAAKQKMFTRSFAEAIELWTCCIDQQFVPLPPQSTLFATLYTQRAEAYLRMKDYAKALKDCALVLYHQEDNIPTWLIRFQAYHGLGQHETVVEELQHMFQQQKERYGQDRRLAEAYARADFLLRKQRRVDYYQLLDVPSIASTMEIKKAYKKKSLEYHPDRLPPGSSVEDQKRSQQQFQLLGEALEILCDDFQRKLYDEGYDAAAIRERVEAANQAAHRQSYHGHHNHNHHH